jgi:hypothetical protein
MLRTAGARAAARPAIQRPVVVFPWPKRRKSHRVQEILNTVLHRPGGEVAFFEDELDVHPNPRIGRDWMLRGQQKLVVTPGQNKKRYVAGALGVRGDRLVWVCSERKNSELSVALLEKLGLVRRYLRQQKGFFVLHFLSPYSPEHKRGERLLQEVHKNVTRNHRCPSIEDLMTRVG